MSIIDIYKRIFKIISPHRKKKLYFSIFGGIANSLIDIIALSSIFPAIYIATNPRVINSNKILNNIFQFLRFTNEDMFVLFILFIILLLFLFRMLFNLMVLKYQYSVSLGAASEFSEKMSKVFFLKNILEIKRTTLGELDKEIRLLPVQFSNFVLVPLTIIISEMVVIFLILLSIISINYKLFFILVISIFPVVGVIYWFIRRKIQHLGIDLNTAATKSFNNSRELISGFADIKMQNKSSFFITRLLDSIKIYNSIQIRINLYQQIIPKLLEWSALALVVLIYIYAILFNESKSEVLMLLAIYLAAAYRLLPSLNRINSSLLLIKQYEFILDVFEKSKGELESKNVMCSDKFSDNLSFNDSIVMDSISLSYSSGDSGLVLKSISLKIKKGEMIGIIGKSGSGKTSLVYVLSGLLPANAGRILVDGVEVNSSNLHLWQQKIAFVYQDIFLVNSNILDNVAFGKDRKNVDEKKVWECLKAVCLDEYVAALPNGLYTMVGESGGFLSGGQKQRLVIARALYRDASLIIMDEATSALDENTQEEVIKSLFETSQRYGITVLLIAHRLSSLKYCNRIIQLENGEIDNEFTYQDLFKENNNH
ncbi:MAG: protein glycosylation K [Bacteroidia bacterium]|nr:MAG: protein glycosylation K [Bacteroidia bacterium]